MKKFIVAIVLFAALGMAAFAQTTTTGAGRRATTVEPQTPGPAQTEDVKALETTAAPKMEAAVAAAAEMVFAQPYRIVTGERLTVIAQQLWGDYRLWPALWVPNRDAVPDPDVIEPGQQLRVVERLVTGPVTAAEKIGLVGAYLAVYKQYKTLGPAKTNNARWVLIEAARFFDAALLEPLAPEVDAADVAWLRSVLR